MSIAVGGFYLFAAYHNGAVSAFYYPFAAERNTVCSLNGVESQLRIAVRYFLFFFCFICGFFSFTGVYLKSLKLRHKSQRTNADFVLSCAEKYFSVFVSAVIPCRTAVGVDEERAFSISVDELYGIYSVCGNIYPAENSIAFFIVVFHDVADFSVGEVRFFDKLCLIRAFHDDFFFKFSHILPFPLGSL